MKTAMQELFSRLETEHPSLFNTHSVDGRNFINSYYWFLELEKQQIIDAFDVACEDQNRIGKEYYLETFKN
jgi:hypothetical protein